MAGMFYGELPVLDLTVTTGLLWFLSFGVLILAVIFHLTEDYPVIAKKLYSISGLFVISIILGGMSGCSVFRSQSYRNLIGTPVNDEFSANVSPIDPNQMILVDEEIAHRLGEKVLGEDPALGSRCNLGSFHLQKVKGHLYWIAPLEHSGFFKWRAYDGTPGYVAVNATNEKDVRLVKEVGGKSLNLRFMRESFFHEYLERHIYFSGYASVGLTDYTFEVDDNWNPYWTVTIFDSKIAWLGDEATGLLIINPETGEIKSYSLDAVPEWVDRVHPIEFIANQVDDWGLLVHGVFNWSNKDKLRTVEDHSIVMGSDGRLYYYIGMHSVGTDNSTVGFMLVDCRTKKSIWIHQAGATETSAKRSAEGIVQAERLVASEGITYNIGGHPTYEFLMKDKEGLMKKIALVNVRNYEDVAIGNDRQSVIRSYLMIVGKNRGNMVSQGVDLIEKKFSGKLTRFGSEVNNGNTLYYFMIEGRDNQFLGNSAISNELCLSKIGDDVEITFIEDDGEINVQKFDNLMINTSLSMGNEDLREENAVVDSVRLNNQRDKVIKDKVEKLTPEEKKKLLELI